MNVPRSYNSPLREDQMEQTRLRILETVADMLADGCDEITVASVAVRAKVSVRTAYRYFQTKEELIDAFNEWLAKHWGTPPLPVSVDELPEMAAKLLESFERNEKLVRAARRSSSATEVRKRRKADQLRMLMRAIAKHAPHYDDAMVRKISAMFLNILNSEAWLSMTDHVGLTTPQAIEAVQWAIDAFLTKIDSERTRKGRK
jgi:AcrR family transcriptional regulator